MKHCLGFLMFCARFPIFQPNELLSTFIYILFGKYGNGNIQWKKDKCDQQPYT